MNPRRVSFMKLKLFCEAYICKSYTKTGENMSVSQSVVTRAIDDIEEMLGGITLFEQIGNTMHPTKHAHTLYEKVSPSLTQIGNALRTEEDFKSISIASTHSAICTIIPLILKDMKKTIDSSNISLYNTDRTNAINLLRRNIVDIAIFPAFEVPNDVNIIEIIDIDPALIVHKDNPLVHKKNITKEDIFAENLIMVDDYKISENYRELFQSIYDKQRIKINNADYAMIIKFVAAGHGSSLFCDVPLTDTNVSVINVKGILPQIKYYLISQIDTILNHAICEFRECAKGIINDRSSYLV